MTEMQFAIKTSAKGHSRTEPNRKREVPPGNLNSVSSYAKGKKRGRKNSNTEQT